MATAEVCVSRPQPAASYPQPHKTPSPEARAPPGDAGSRGARLLFQSWNGRSHTQSRPPPPPGRKRPVASAHPRGGGSQIQTTPGGWTPSPGQGRPGSPRAPRLQPEPSHTHVPWPKERPHKGQKFPYLGPKRWARGIQIGAEHHQHTRDGKEVEGERPRVGGQQRWDRGSAPLPLSGASHAVCWGPSARALQPPSPGGGTWAGADPGSSQPDPPASLEAPTREPVAPGRLPAPGKRFAELPPSPASATAPAFQVRASHRGAACGMEGTLTAANVVTTSSGACRSERSLLPWLVLLRVRNSKSGTGVNRLAAELSAPWCSTAGCGETRCARRASKKRYLNNSEMTVKYA